MKRNANSTLALLLIFILLLVIIYLLDRQNRRDQVPMPIHIHPPQPTYRRPKQPEFRDPPIKEYNPKSLQQLGLLIGENEETLPLYGKEVRGRRDQYHYYTSTPGNQIYSIPVSHNGRDCMGDIGCNELYGNEDVNVLGKSNSYQAKLYRTDNFF
tara:strand:- start:9845 stop:10309 length:465 start_codon:yes stop_codon:yes gene_type:complete